MRWVPWLAGEIEVEVEVLRRQQDVGDRDPPWLRVGGRRPR
jgi:hypothetical protein